MWEEPSYNADLGIERPIDREEDPEELFDRSLAIFIREFADGRDLTTYELAVFRETYYRLMMVGRWKEDLYNGYPLRRTPDDWRGP